MATLLINNIAAPPIPIKSFTNFSIHNPNGIEAELLKNLLEINFKNIVCKSYNQSKMEWNFVTDMTALNGDDLLFEGASTAELVNEGIIKAKNGQIVLLGYRIENKGTLSSF